MQLRSDALWRCVRASLGVSLTHFSHLLNLARVVWNFAAECLGVGCRRQAAEFGQADFDILDRECVDSFVILCVEWSCVLFLYLGANVPL